MKDKQRRRVKPEDVRGNATAAGVGVAQFFTKLPEGVEVWQPKKPGKYILDIVPYLVKAENHPDNVATPGTIWYKFPFDIHRNVGPQDKSIVCPRALGKKCPICEEVDKLKKNWDENEDLIKDLRGQRYVAYNILNPNDQDKIAIFAMSKGKFATALEKELEEGDEELLGFYDVTSDGHTLRVRFSEAEFSNRKYLEATRIDFKKREEMDEDEILGKTICFEEHLVVLPYDKIKAMTVEGDDDDEDNKDEDEDEKPSKKPSKKDEDEGWDDDEDEEKKPSKKPSKKDEDEDDDWGDDEDEEKPSKKSKDDDEDEDEDEKPSKKKDEDEDDEDDEKPKVKKCKACGGSGKSSKGKTCIPCNGTGVLRDDSEDDEDEEEEEEKKPSKKTRDDDEDDNQDEEDEKPSKKKKDEDEDDDEDW